MLKGIRILDLSRLLPGPYGSLLLADMGAEVIKVEDTSAGDYIRDHDPKVKNVSAYYLAINRNKKSIRINYRDPAGKDIFLKLVADADVVLESFRPGVMDAWGIGYSELKKINPDLVYCALTGYGQTGCNKKKAGHDINYLSVSGILDISGIRNGRPVMPGIQVADLSGGMFAVIGILSALVRKKQTGEGCYLDVSMVDGLLSLMALYVGQYQAEAQPLKRGELNLSGGLVCYNIYQTKDDRYVVLGSLEYKFWKNFCMAIKRVDLVKDHLAKAIDGDFTYEEIKRIFLEMTLAEWEEILGTVDCCFSPIQGINEVLAGSLVRERGITVKINDSIGGEFNQIGIPIKFILNDGKEYPTGGGQILFPPIWGQHTDLVLSKLGYSDSDLEELKAKGIV